MSGFPMARLRRMSVYREKSETTGKLKSALAKAQSQFLPVEKDTEAEWGRFASLDSMIRSTRAALTANDLAVDNEFQPVDGQLYLVTVLTHGESDEWVSSVLPIRVVDDTDDTLAYMTKMRRVNYAALLCLAPENEKGVEQQTASADAKAAAKDWTEQHRLAQSAIASAPTVQRVDEIVQTIRTKIAAGQMDPHSLAYLETAADRRRQDLAKPQPQVRQAPPTKSKPTKQEVPA